MKISAVRFDDRNKAKKLLIEIKYNYKDVYPDDIIFDSEIVTGTKLLSKID